MVDMLEADDTFDLDWLPEKLKNKREKRKKGKKGKYSLVFSHISLIMQSERPETYKKGPDVTSYRDLLIGHGYSLMLTRRA